MNKEFDMKTLDDVKTETDTLGAITDIWKQVLEQPEIAADADFFDIGGNSMLLIATLSLIEERLHVQIKTDDLANGVTPEIMARLAANNG
jgi:acyl carrier protein